MKVCLTGGIACGKSLLSHYLNELGVETIDADDVVHTLIPDPAERKRLAAEVFTDPEKRKALEARLHPQVKVLIEAFLNSPPPPSASASVRDLRLAVIPLLFEVHWENDFDIICCIRSAKEKQLERMMTTRGYSRQEAEGRLAAQMPVDEKAAKSHYVIDNDGTAEELKLRAGEFVEWLAARCKGVTNMSRT